LNDKSLTSYGEVNDQSTGKL